MAKILVIEDEQSLQTILEYDLSQHNHDVDLCGDGQEGLEMIKDNHYDLAIIDWMVPSLSGIDVVQKVREFNKKIRLILLTAKDDEMDIVRGLEAGANDYVTKPFSPRELSARIRGLLRDVEHEQQEEGVVQVTARITIDYPKRDIFLDDKIVELTKLEYDLFVYLVENKNTVVSREQIMQHIWSYDYESENRVIDVYIHSIKKKLDIVTEIESKRGVGYIFVG
ncbi:two-component system alkaline phosphatase synthesis response regulator PhoP [Bacilli bacterium PM5-3]|nr:two-component system alkaline phosphatase synthesis response regulator PhoP [Bacilli bacterium PM5-3]MDH6603417.1 two-component system alkaline phosphatase synthesis response regulator PhoP [Bacilli bacterium PM5-9]